MIVFDFNQYVLEHIQDLLDADDIVVPLQEEPDGAGAYVLYEFERKPDSVNHWSVDTIDLTYECWSPSYDDAIEMEERIERLVRGDYTYVPFEDWLRARPLEDEYGNPIPRHRYTVHELSFVFGGDLAPPTQEGGKYGRVIVIQLRFSNWD